MKKILRAAFITFTVLSASFAGQAQHAFLDQPLLEALDEAQSVDLISIAIMLEDEVDLLSLKKEFNKNSVPAKQRAPLVEQALQEKAAATQSFILSFIENSNMAYADIETFWISNTIALKAAPELVEALANLDEVSYMYLNRNAFGYMPKEKKGVSSTKSEGGIEPGLEAIGAPEMWAMGYTGHGRIAMTYDTGVWDDHPSHKSRFLANRMPLLSTWYGYDSPIPIDKSSSHGTHVTGTMLGLDTATSDTIGMAPRAYYIATDPVVSNLADVKPLTDFMFGYEWSLDPDGDPLTTTDIPDVINNSWGFGPTLDEAPCPEFVVPVFTALEVAGIANVFSAGNEGPGDMTMSVPHNTNIGLVNSFTVGATSALGNYTIASFSSRGPSICGGEGSLLIKPEVSAPGVNVRSSIENGEYDFFSGTSMAAPHVSGAVLLLREAFPEVTGEEILLAIYNSATDLGEPGEDNTYGMGLVNVKDAYDLLSETHTPTPPEVLNNDIELVRIIDPADSFFWCAGASEGISPMIEVRNNGLQSIDGFNLIMSIVGQDEDISAEVQVILEPGDTEQIQLQDISVDLGGIIELYIRILPLEDEYDSFNNHAVRRFVKLPIYDWDVNGPFEENFEDGIDSETWTVYNPDISLTWDTLSVIQSNGSIGKGAYMAHPDYLVSDSQDDHLISPRIENKPENVNTLAFDYFYRKLSFLPYNRDTLVVYINRSCDDEYMSEELFRAGGEELWSNDSSKTDALPEVASDWKTLYFDIESENNEPFFFSFVSLNQNGNNLLVDNIRIGSNLSTSQVLDRLAAKIYPNPTNGSFRIEWNKSGRAEVRVFDLSGRVIHIQRNFENGATIGNLNLSKGVYIIEILADETKSAQKLIVN